MTTPTGTPARRRPSSTVSRGGAGTARLMREQRRRYAATVLRTLARTQRGRPTPQVERVLRQAFTSSGVRLTPRALHDIAHKITAGHPVELP